jgi:hypothetical protein
MTVFPGCCGHVLDHTVSQLRLTLRVRVQMTCVCMHVIGCTGQDCAGLCGAFVQAGFETAGMQASCVHEKAAVHGFLCPCYSTEVMFWGSLALMSGAYQRWPDIAHTTAENAWSSDMLDAMGAMVALAQSVLVTQIGFGSVRFNACYAVCKCLQQKAVLTKCISRCPHATHCCLGSEYRVQLLSMGCCVAAVHAVGVLVSSTGTVADTMIVASRCSGSSSQAGLCCTCDQGLCVST